MDDTEIKLENIARRLEAYRVSGADTIRQVSRELKEKRSHDDLLTDLERKAMDQSAALWNSLCAIVDEGGGHPGDFTELIKPIHDIQRAIMAQAGARAGGYRLLGNGAGWADKNTGQSSTDAFEQAEKKLHIASEKDYVWECLTPNCRAAFFISKRCESHPDDCWRHHSITNCPECDARSIVERDTHVAAEDVWHKYVESESRVPVSLCGVRSEKNSRVEFANLDSDVSCKACLRMMNR